MAFYFEEKDRALIESEYGSIIEFKRELYKAIHFSKRVAVVLSECWDKVKAIVVELVYQLKEVVIPSFVSCFERIKESFDNFFETDLCLDFEPRECYKFVKKLCKAGYYDLQTYEKRIRINNTIRYHCRNNC